jgi:spore germination protein YaaH
MKKTILYTVVAMVMTVVVCIGSQNTAAAADLEVSAWIPYWKSAEGIRDARKHLDVLTEINPFGYAVKQDGSLNDLAGLKKSKWAKLFKEARKKNVRIVPTVMWSDTTNIHAILSDTNKREDHIDEIVKMVKKGKYDGVDIDYEGKKAETKDYYSAFLTELKAELGSKKLVCTIEARTPPASLYKTIPAELRYANDYTVINRVCDEVKIMTYDQQRADLLLNSSKAGSPYYPIADIDWVRKVMDLTAQSIDKDKLYIGVATYGRELEITASPNAFSGYKQQWSVTHEYAMDFADDEADVVPSRNQAGELSYTYLPEGSTVKFPKNLSIPKNTPTGNEVAAKALALANQTGQSVKFNLVWWSDAEAIQDKVELAERLGLAGVAVFKVDETEDDKLWDILEK